MLAGIQGAVAYLDNIIIVGRTVEEHNAALRAVFQRVQTAGFHLRKDKCVFFLPSVKYLGQIIDAEGRRPDPSKTAAVARMPVPSDVSTLRAFLGMINYYGQYVKEMRLLRAPLDALLKKDVPFVWSAECEQAVLRAKEILQSDLLLTHYDPKLPIIVAADASTAGIGAVISHKFPDGSEKAICHVLCALSSAEKKYSQIEKEGLSLIFAFKKFHRMIYGRRVMLLTDHKPLLAIFGSMKGIPVHTANRLQRWSAILLAYDFRIEYRKSEEFGQADALSRLLADQPNSDEDMVIAAVRAEEVPATQLVAQVFSIMSIMRRR